MTQRRRWPALVGIWQSLLLGAIAPSCALAQAAPATSQSSIQAPSADAEPECILHLTSGRRLSGRLVARSEADVTIRIGEVPTTFKRADIDRVEVLPPVHDRYVAMRAAIDDTDVAGLMVLVDWLCARQCYDEAITELDHVLIAEPGNRHAREQRKLIDQLRVLANPAPADPERPAPERAPRPERPDFPLLSVDDINLIKVYETDLAKPPRLRVDRETILDLIKAYAQSDLIPTSKEGRDALLRQSPERILDLMFRLRAREFYGRVKVIDQPESMRQFRDQVHGTWLLNACATDRCHGGSEAGRLMLYNRSRNAETAVYTNFLIIERATLADGTPLINYDQPQRSPLLHLGLPRERSLYPHPESQAARGWKPSFTSQRDRRYEQALDWIRSMYRPRPEYPVTYTPPSGNSLLGPRDPQARDQNPEAASPQDPPVAPALGPPVDPATDVPDSKPDESDAPPAEPPASPGSTPPPPRR